MVVKDVRVTEVPRDATRADGVFPEPDGGAGPEAGALVVLSVERETAAALAGAGVSGRLAVAVSHAD